MNKKKIRPGAATPKRNEDKNNEKMLSSFQSFPQDHSNSTEPGTQVVFQISNLLSHGEENAVTTAALMESTGLNMRQLQDQIRRERTAGKLILSKASGDGGYFLPDTDPDKGREEIKQFRRTILNRGVNTIKLVTMCDNALATIPGQENIKDDGRTNGGT